MALFHPFSWLSNIPLCASLVAQMVKNLPAMWDTWVQSLGWEDTLEEVMSTLASVLAWRIPMNRGTLAGYSPWCHKESDMTERLSTHTILLYIWINMTYQLFFIHSPVKRNLVYFHILAVVNSIAVKTGVHITFQAIFFFRYLAYIHRKSTYSFKWLIFLKTHYIFVLRLNIWIPLLQLTPLE